MADFPYSFNSPVSGNKTLDNALSANFRSAAAYNAAVANLNTVSNVPPVGVIMGYGHATAPAGWLQCNGQEVSRTEYPELFALIGTSFGTGDGTYTFNVPNTLGRTLVGAGAAGRGGGVSGAGWINNSGAALTARTLGSWTGAETMTVTTAQLPSHAHGVSITTGGESADHTHTGTTGNTSADHGHSGTTAGASADHTHAGVMRADTTRLINTTAGTSYNMNWGGMGTDGRSADHTHDFSTAGASANHTHAFTTGGRSAGHTHLVTGNTATAGSGTPLPVVQPQLGVYYIIKARSTGSTGVSTAVDSSDPRLSDARTPIGAAGGDLSGSYPSPVIGAGRVLNAHIGAAAGIALSKLATNPLARSAHTGFQLAESISDFNEAVLAAQSRVAVTKAGVAVGTRAKINLIEGTNVVLTTADNAGSDRVDVTIGISTEGLVELGSPQLDGGSPSSVYGGTVVLDAGGVT